MLARLLPEPFDSDRPPVRARLGRPSDAGDHRPGRAPGDGEVVLIDTAGRDPAGGCLPELGGLGVRLAARSAILDGELVVVDARRASRLAARAPPGGEPGRPVAFLAFDLLHLDGRVPAEHAPRAAAST